MNAPFITGVAYRRSIEDEMARAVAATPKHELVLAARTIAAALQSQLDAIGPLARNSSSTAGHHGAAVNNAKKLVDLLGRIDATPNRVEVIAARVRRAVSAAFDAWSTP